MARPVAPCLLFLFSVSFLSCNSPFQPEVQYTPKLNVYSVLFGNSREVYVRVSSVAGSESDVSQPVHGARVTLTGTAPGGGTLQNITLADTTEIIDGDSASFYYAPASIMPGGTYSISVAKDGYPLARASVQVPVGYATLPDQSTYSILRYPKNIKSEINFVINFSPYASAEFVQMLVEFRGLDSTGNFHAGAFNVLPIDSINPFREIQTFGLRLTVDTTQYQAAYNLASREAASMKVSHMYVDVIVTQVDDSFYRFFITSTRSADPLQMRTDKVIFTNIFNNAGTGVVAGASVDTTRIFLF